MLKDMLEKLHGYQYISIYLFGFWTKSGGAQGIVLALSVGYSGLCSEDHGE